MKEVKYMFNTSKMIAGVNIACVGWKNNKWLIIENEETFEDARKDDFIPIATYRTAKELCNAIIK